MKEIPISDFNRYQIDEDVSILSQVVSDFEDLYLKLRTKEQRIYSDEEVEKLPFASASNPHKKEWALRAKSFFRFKKFLESKKDNLNILDLGCGNGWFSGQLAKDFNFNFYCVDVNLTELKQGARIFNNEKIKFIYANIFSAELTKNFFDLIVMNASVQYFSALKKLLNRLLHLLTVDGEIHIIDSPFYSDKEVRNAKKRTKDYYSSINFPDMDKHYYHHTFSQLREFNPKYLYNPSDLVNMLKKILYLKDSPLYWIVITK